MGITCKPIGRMRSIFDKVQNELDAAEKERKKLLEEKREQKGKKSK